MRRLYFLLPGLERTQDVVNELLLARVEERHIHVIAAPSTNLGELPKAGLLQKSDFIPAMERGLALGGATGVLAGLAALTLSGVVVAGGALLATGLVGAGMGAWLGGMIGMDVDNVHIKRFQTAIDSGQILVLVDTPKARVHEIEALVRHHHPEVDFEGTEPSIPPFP